jgi:hypothetical protein
MYLFEKSDEPSITPCSPPSIAALITERQMEKFELAILIPLF